MVGSNPTRSGGWRRLRKNSMRRMRHDCVVDFKSIPAAGTQLVREWQGTEHRVTVRDDGAFEYQGQPFKSLSAIARTITGTRWNGWVFFGMKNQRAAS